MVAGNGSTYIVVSSASTLAGSHGGRVAFDASVSWAYVYNGDVKLSVCIAAQKGVIVYADPKLLVAHVHLCTHITIAVVARGPHSRDLSCPDPAVFWR